MPAGSSPVAAPDFFVFTPPFIPPFIPPFVPAALPPIAIPAPGFSLPVLRTFRVIAADIKIAHSVFALPFAILAATMAAVPLGGGRPEWGRFGTQMVLVVIAMVCARTVAMLANRMLDRHFDAENPRTAGRAIPAGRLSIRQAWAAVSVAAALFMGVCAAFGLLFQNWWPIVLGVPVLTWISAYGLFKRFSALCHVYLGSSLAISPLAAIIAVDPSRLAEPAPWLLATMVLCWVAGFDVIYALQDVDVDRRQGLHSMPARWGVRRAMWASRALHVVAAAALWSVVLVDPRFGLGLGIAAAIVAALLVAEHATVARWGTGRMALTFFTINGAVSLAVGALGVADLLRSASSAV